MVGAAAPDAAPLFFKRQSSASASKLTTCSRLVGSVVLDWVMVGLLGDVCFQEGKGMVEPRGDTYRQVNRTNIPEHDRTFQMFGKK